MKAVQRMLGHSSAQVTLDRYSHLFDYDLERLADNTDARYGADQVRTKPGSGVVLDSDKIQKKDV